MRHDEAHERDDANERDRDTGEESHQHDRDQTQPLDLHAEVRRGAIAEREKVVPPREADRGGRGRRRCRR